LRAPDAPRKFGAVRAPLSPHPHDHRPRAEPERAAAWVAVRALVVPAAAMLALAAPRVGAQAVPLPGPPPAANAAPGPTAALDGVVRDGAGGALAGVAVSADHAGRTTYSDSVGAFRLRGLPPGPGRFSVRRIGYQPSDFEIDLPTAATVHLAITLQPAAQRLETVVVNGELRDAALSDVGFYERAASESARFGSGRFLSPEALAPLRASWLSAALRRVTDVRLEGTGARASAQFRDAHGRLGCAPEVWIDGAHTPTPFAALDGLVPVAELRAVEVYPWPRSVPPQFRLARQRSECGALVLWTNRIDER
jgi:hypothetical protein